MSNSSTEMSASIQRQISPILKAEIERIFQAVKDDNLEILKDEEQNLNFSALRNNSGETLLHVATKNDSSQCLEYLLTHAKMDPNVKNQKGETPLDLALSSRKLFLNNMKTIYHQINILISYGARTHQEQFTEDKILLSLRTALRQENINHKKVFSYFLEKPFSKINHIDFLNNGSTLLHILMERATSLGKEKAYAILILLLQQRNIHVNIRNTANETPLDITVRTGNLFFMEKLRIHGAICINTHKKGFENSYKNENQSHNRVYHSLYSSPSTFWHYTPQQEFPNHQNLRPVQSEHKLTYPSLHMGSNNI